MKSKVDYGEITRKKIYRFILEFPGLSRSSISYKTHIPYSTLKYHLEYMKKREIIIEKKDDKYLRYYIKNTISSNEKRLLSLLRKQTVREIILYIHIFKSASLQEISNFWRKDPRTIAYHIKQISKYIELDKVKVGKEIYYEYKDPWMVLELILKYKDVLFDDLFVENIEWLEEGWFTSDKATDLGLNVIWEIFPHPYHA